MFRRRHLRAVKCDKLKDGPEWELNLAARRIELPGNPGPFGGQRSSLILESIRHSEQRETIGDRVLSTLGEAGPHGMTATELRLALALPDTQRSSLYGALGRLKDGGRITKDGSRFRIRGGGQ